MKQPCKKDCPSRGPYCRGQCDKWEQYETARNAEYDKRKNIQELKEYMCAASYKMSHSRSSNGIRL